MLVWGEWTADKQWMEGKAVRKVGSVLWRWQCGAVGGPRSVCVPTKLLGILIVLSSCFNMLTFTK